MEFDQNSFGDRDLKTPCTKNAHKTEQNLEELTYYNKQLKNVTVDSNDRKDLASLRPGGLVDFRFGGNTAA